MVLGPLYLIVCVCVVLLNTTSVVVTILYVETGSFGGGIESFSFSRLALDSLT